MTSLDIVFTLDSKNYIFKKISAHILGEGIEDTLLPPVMKLYPVRIHEEQKLRMGYDTRVRQEQEP